MRMREEQARDSRSNVSSARLLCSTLATFGNLGGRLLEMLPDASGLHCIYRRTRTERRARGVCNIIPPGLFINSQGYRWEVWEVWEV